MDSGKLVLALLDEAYEKKTWHGPNLKQSLKGVTAEEAAWRPGPGRHNISGSSAPCGVLEVCRAAKDRRRKARLLHSAGQQFLSKTRTRQVERRGLARG